MRFILFISDFLIIVGVAGILYLVYQQGKDDAKKGGDKKDGKL